VHEIAGTARVTALLDLLARRCAQERAEIERTAIAGLLDPAYYRARYPSVRASGADPVTHFAERGWRELRRPCAEFDTAWYWSAHLDPAADQVNPLVHYALLGRDEGLASRAPFPEPADAERLPAGARRAVLFAGYDQDGVVDDTVLAYLAELSRHADVFYLADGDLRAGELARLDGVTVGAWSVRHGAYDFGSYSLLARELVGWERLDAYDEVVLANDSCYLLGPLDDLFATMSARPCAWWGLQGTERAASPAYGASIEVMTSWHAAPVRALIEPMPACDVPATVRDMFARFPEQEFHVGSYFVALRRPVLRDETVRRFLSAVRVEARKVDIIERYEFGLTRLLVSRGHRLATFIEDLYPFHPVYSEWAFELVQRGFPLLKRALLAENPFGVDLAHWQDRVRASAPDARIEDIETHLRRTVDAAGLAEARSRRLSPLPTNGSA